KALVKQTAGPDPKQITLPPGALLRKAAGPQVVGLVKQNPAIWQVRTNVSFSAPAAKFGSAVLKKGGRTGASKATFAGPGGGLIFYTKPAAQFGGPARIKVAPATQIRLWGRPGLAPSPPCAHPKLGGTQMYCLAVLVAEYPPTAAAPGAPVGFTAKTP